MVWFTTLMTLLLGRILFFHIPTFRVHNGQLEHLKKVTVIIPARNEGGISRHFYSPYSRIVKK